MRIPLDGRKGAVIIMTGSLVIATGAGFGMYAAFSGGTTKASSTSPLLGPTSMPSASPVAAANEDNDGGSCTIGRSGDNVQITLAGDGADASTCQQFGQDLAKNLGGFWQAETQNLSLSLSCVMDVPNAGTATVMDSGSQFYGQQVCQDLQAGGAVEDTTAEGGIVQGQQSASAAAAAAESQSAAAAAQQSQDAADYSAAQNAIANLASDVQGMNGDVSGTSSDITGADNDLKAEQHDATQAGSGDCGDVDTVGGDADTVSGDEDTVGGDEDTAAADISSVRNDIAQLQQDDQALQADNVAPPSITASAITSAQQAVKSAISTMNADIDTVAGYVTKAYELANSLATGSCAGMGPGSAPAPPTHLS
ncbi:hypothetical protein KDL01_29090 [Actinospica durhamensis]|uniref:Uncharacterized protein n=1 Tax=Actinospica durhamensis TaxID=1508375 RepID=A0A941ETK5_9ACTN|nr:hypothetical protein [Actinospica durhamensis]MBR7837370.1 hypothetical protein [Actinospica durhamensis]